MNAAVSHLEVFHSGSRAATAPLRDWIRSAGQRLKIWIEAYASAAAQAALYEQLYGLSDAELKRRGIPRSELHRYVFE
jgi:hypothetical protein